MVREDGVLRSASWDEALERAARGMDQIRRDHGPERAGDVLLLEGDQRDELRRAEVRPAVLGTNNIDSCNRT
jgi:formate dehydrogenase (hydrogenase)